MWKRIFKADIKNVPVGSEIKVNGTVTRLKSHHNDSGFDMEDMVYLYDECTRFFYSTMWDIRSVYVWCEQSDFGDLV